MNKPIVTMYGPHAHRRALDRPLRVVGRAVESALATVITPVRRAYDWYAMSVSIKKNTLNTSFLSDAQATDSTRNGCTAKRLAASRLGHLAPVALVRNQNSNTELAT